MNRTFWPLRVVLAAWSLALCLGVYWQVDSLPPRGDDLPPLLASSDPGSWHMPIRLDYPAIEEPPLEYADEVALEDEAIVIGIVVNGEPRAYLREAFADDPQRHVVTDSIDSTPVAITHCDRIGCTRVLTGIELEETGSIRVGGWRADQTLALIVGEEEYSQKSEEIPLADVPFLELPWGMWRELFPDTLVYVGARAG